MTKKSYEALKAEVKKLKARGEIRDRPNDEERADWAYGTTVIENADVTRDMATKAARETSRRSK